MSVMVMTLLHVSKFNAYDTPMAHPLGLVLAGLRVDLMTLPTNLG